MFDGFVSWEIFITFWEIFSITLHELFKASGIELDTFKYIMVAFFTLQQDLVRPDSRYKNKYYPSESKASREVANLTERNIHIPRIWCQRIFLSVCYHSTVTGKRNL